MAFQAISDQQPSQCFLRALLDLFQVFSTSLKLFLERIPRAVNRGGQINTNAKPKLSWLLLQEGRWKIHIRHFLSFPGVSQQRESTQALPTLWFFSPVLKIRGILESNIPNVTLFHLSVHAEKKCCWNKKVEGSN